MRWASTGNCERTVSSARRSVRMASPMGGLLLSGGGGGVIAQVLGHRLAQQAREVQRLDEQGITKGPREQGTGNAFDDQTARAAFVQAALAGIEQRVFGQGAPG